MANQVDLSTGYYPTPTIGRALSNANIYVGVVDLDPEIVANQKQISVLQENGTTINVSQPIITSAGGVPQYNGSPVTILVDGSYSIKVTDSGGSQVYYVPKNAELESIVSFDSIADLRAITDTPADGDTFTLLGYDTPGDGGGGSFYWDATSTETDNGGTIIKVTAITTGRWLRLYDYIKPDFFGGNTTPGTTDMSTAIQAAINLVTANTRVPIEFSGDEYYIGATTLTIPVNGITLSGNGSIITYDGTDTALKTGTVGATRYDCTFTNVVFDTTTAAGALNTLVDLRGFGRFNMAKCRVKTNGNDAVWLGTAGVTDSSIQTTFRDTQFNMEILGSGTGIFVDDDKMTLLKIEDCIFNEGDSQIVLANTGGSSASTEINHNTFQNGVTSIEVVQSTVKNLAITNNYAELYTEAFVKSASPYTSSNNRISSGGTLVYDISSHLPNIRMTNPDEFTGGATIPIPNFPGSNRAINSDMSIWGDDDGSDQIPFGFTAGALASVVFSKESTIKLVGESSLKVVTAATNRDMIQRVSRESELVGLRGRRVYLCAWVYTSDASAVRLQIADGVGSSNSVNPLYHPGDGEWQYLVATRIIDSAATVIDFKVRNSIAVSTYYLDSFCWSVDEPVSLYAVPSAADAGYKEISNEISIDLSGAATTKYMLHNTTGNNIYLNKATIVYTEASSADAGILLEIGKETDVDYFYTGTSETSQSKYSSTDLTLLKNIIGDGDTVTFTSAGGKTGTGEVKLVLEYLSN